MNTFSGTPTGLIASPFRLVFWLLLAVIVLMPFGQVRAEAGTSAVPVAVANKIAPEIWRKVQAGEVRELLVLFGDDAVAVASSTLNAI